MSAIITKSMAKIGATPGVGERRYRTDSAGNKVELVGYDYNRDMLKNLALDAAARHGFRADAAAVGIEQDLQERDEYIWEEQRAPLTAAEFVPMAPNASKFADARQMEWRKKELFSDALVKGSLNAPAGDIPDVSASMKAELVDIWNVLAKYSVTLDEQLYAGRLRFNFGAEYAAECQRAIARAMDQAILIGNSDLSIEGFLDHSDVTTITADTGTWYAGGATSDQILADIEKVMASIRDAVAHSSVVSGEMADHVLMSDRLHAYLSKTKTFGTATDRSILDIIKERYPELNWDNFTHELRDTGASGAGYDRMVFYRKDPRHVAAAIPVPYQERPMITEAMSDVVYAYGRFVPVTIFDKRAIRYMDIDIAA